MPALNLNTSIREPVGRFVRDPTIRGDRGWLVGRFMCCWLAPTAKGLHLHDTDIFARFSCFPSTASGLTHFALAWSAKSGLFNAQKWNVMSCSAIRAGYYRSGEFSKRLPPLRLNFISSYKDYNLQYPITFVGALNPSSSLAVFLLLQFSFVLTNEIIHYAHFDCITR